MFTRRRLRARSLISVLLSTAIGVSLISIGANPAEADPNPIEDKYALGSGEAPFTDVVYNNGGHGGDQNEDCVVEEEPQGDWTVVYPEDFYGEHPVVVWGNGTMGSIDIEPYIDPEDLPDDWPDGIEQILIEDQTCYYEDTLKHFAAWGFVVIAPNDGFVGSGSELHEAVEVAHWFNGVDSNNPLYGNLDLSSITAAGHSQGAAGAINAAVADSRITSVLGVSTPDEGYCEPTWKEALNAIEWDYYCATLGTASQLDVPIFFISGENDSTETDLLMRPFFSTYLLARYGYWSDPDKGNDPDEAQYYADLYWWVVLPWNTPWISSPTTVDNFYNQVPGAAAKGIVQADASGEGAGHLDVREGIGYATAWLAYMSCNPAFPDDPEDAFVGVSPEIKDNTGWANADTKNLPAEPLHCAST